MILRHTDAAIRHWANGDHADQNRWRVATPPAAEHLLRLPPFCRPFPLPSCIFHQTMPCPFRIWPCAHPRSGIFRLASNTLAAEKPAAPRQPRRSFATSAGETTGKPTATLRQSRYRASQLRAGCLRLRRVQAWANPGFMAGPVDDNDPQRPLAPSMPNRSKFIAFLIEINRAGPRHSAPCTGSKARLTNRDYIMCFVTNAPAAEILQSRPDTSKAVRITPSKSAGDRVDVAVPGAFSWEGFPAPDLVRGRGDLCDGRATFGALASPGGRSEHAHRSARACRACGPSGCLRRRAWARWPASAQSAARSWPAVARARLRSRRGRVHEAGAVPEVTGEFGCARHSPLPGITPARPGSAAAAAPRPRTRGGGAAREREDGVCALGAVAQRVVHDHQRQQCLGNGGRTDADAGVMAPLGADLDAVAMDVDRRARAEDGTGGLDGNAQFQVLPGADAAEHAARVVAAKPLRGHGVAMHGAALRHAGKARADLHALDGVQAHQRVGDVGIELVIQRLAQAHRHARGLHADAGAAGVAGLAQCADVLLVLRHIGHRGEEGVVAHMVPVLERDG